LTDLPVAVAAKGSGSAGGKENVCLAAGVINKYAPGGGLRAEDFNQAFCVRQQ